MNAATLLAGSSEALIDAALLIIRLFIGPCFVMHGLGKLGVIGSGNLDGFAAWLDDLGVPFAAAQARMAMASEIGGGILLTLGLLTRPACVVLIGTMVVAGAVGHRGAGYMITNDPPGAEYTINLAGVCLALLLTGAGAYSLDASLF